MASKKLLDLAEELVSPAITKKPKAKVRPKAKSKPKAVYASPSTKVGEGTNIDLSTVTLPEMSRVPGADPNFGPTGRISTRVPKRGKETLPETYSGALTIGQEQMEQGGTLGKNMEFTSQFPGFGALKGLPPEDAAKIYNAIQRKNIEFTLDRLPPEFQDRSKMWYVGANRIAEELSNKYGIPRSSASGALAALSPQMDWFKNASLGERVIDTLIAKRDVPWSAEMDAIPKKYPAFTSPTKNAGVPNYETWASIRGKKLSELETPIQKAMWIRAYDEAHNPKTYRAITPEGELGDIMLSASGKPMDIGWGGFGEISKAVQAAESGGDFNKISDAMGSQHKVRNFFNNIEVPFSDQGDITVDTHQIAVGAFRPLAGSDDLTNQGLGGMFKNAPTGSMGNYGQQADNVRAVAADRGLLPREAQSISWEGIRGLFDVKTPKTKQMVDDIWRAYDRGDLSQDQALAMIEERMGGFKMPTWFSEPSPKRSIGRGNSTMYGLGGLLGMGLLDQALDDQDKDAQMSGLLGRGI